MISKNAVLSIFVVLLFSSFVFCQNPLKKGVYKLGGSIEFNSISYDGQYSETDESTFRLTPLYSYFVTDNLMVGGTFSFIYDEFNYKFDLPNGRESTEINRGLGLGPTLNYYFNSEKFIPFIGCGVMYLKSLGNDGYTYSFYGQAGINYFFSSNTALEPFLSYEIMKYDGSDDSRKNFTIGVRLSYFITD